jgi:hypothetical protein
MKKDWSIDDKSGEFCFPNGEVVYQTKGVVTEPIYVVGYPFESGAEYYIENDGKLLQIGSPNPFNGYCYRQDGL